jgi:hypothetical protein
MLTSRISRIVPVILLSVLPFMACSKMAQLHVAGTYTHENNSEEFLELKSNGSYYLRESGMGVVGKYEVDGNQITLKTDMGFASRGIFAGDTLVDEEGQRWTKK